jgi:hypothetical protein
MKHNRSMIFQFKSTKYLYLVNHSNLYRAHNSHNSKQISFHTQLNSILIIMKYNCLQQKSLILDNLCFCLFYERNSQFTLHFNYAAVGFWEWIRKIFAGFVTPTIANIHIIIYIFFWVSFSILHCGMNIVWWDFSMFNLNFHHTL